MAIDDFDFDDLDLDGLDFDIPDVDAVAPKDDRSPVTRAVTNFAKGTAKGIISTDGLEDVIRRGLPEGYSLALNTKSAIGTTFDAAYRSAAKDIEPVVRGVKNALGKVSKKTQGKIPKWVQDRLDNLAQPAYKWEDGRPKSAADTDFSAQLAEIFKVQQQADLDNRSEERADQLVRDKIDTERFNNQQDALQVIARGVDRLVGYQDQVEINYQRESLHTQLKQLALLQQIGTRTETDNALAISELRNIVKNTGLPEVNKIQMSELAKKMLNEKLAGGAINTVSNFSQKYFSQLGGNIGAAAKGFLSGGSGELSMMQNMLEGMSPQERQQFLATGAGAGLGNWLRGEAAMAAAPYLERLGPVTRLGNKLKSGLSDLPGMLDSYAKSQTTREGFMGTAEQFIKDLLPKYFQDETLGKDMLMSSDSAAYYDEQSRRSLTEIIPGLLSQVARWTQMTATGEDPGDSGMMVYNQVRGGFTTKRDMVNDVSERILPRHARRALQSNLNDALVDLDAERQLTEPAFAALRRQMLIDAALNRKFDAKRLSQYETYEHVTDDRVKSELVQFIRNKFNLDATGNVYSGSEDEFNVLSGKMADRQLALKNTIPAPDEAIRALSRVVGRDAIRQMGFIRREGLTDKIDMANLYDRMLESPESNNPLAENAPLPPGERRKIEDVVRDIVDSEAGKPVIRNAGPHTGDLSREFLAEYWGEESLVIDELRKLRGEQTEQNASILSALESMEFGLGGGGEGAPRGSRFSRAAGWIKDKAIWGSKNYLKFWGKLYGGAWDLGKKSVGVATGLFTSGADVLADVYVKGEREPRLYARKFREEAYYDAETLEPLKSHKDITGPVLDINGDYLITAEDFAKGLTSRGKSIASGIWDGLSKLTKGYAGLVMLPTQLVLKAGKGIWDFGKNQINKVRDLYIAGEKEPRILARLLEQGDVYWSMTKGKFCTTIDDLVGEIRKGGPTGDIIVTESELRKAGGWVTATGEKVRSAVGGVIGVAGRLVKGYVKGVFGIYRAIGRGLKGLFKGLTGKGPDLKLSGDFQEDLVKIGYAQLSVQEKILQLLQRMAGGEQHVWDKDGDGLLEGSWQAARKKKEEDAKSSEVTDAVRELSKGGGFGGLGGGMFDKLKGLFGKKGSGGDDDDDEGGGGFMDAILGGGKGGKGKFARLAPLAGKAALAAGAVVLSAGLSNKLEGRSFFDTTSYKEMALNANPVSRLLLGSQRKGWDFGTNAGRRFASWIHGTDRHIAAYRMAQYGVDYVREKYVSKVIELERFLLKYVSFEGGVAKLDEDSISGKELFQLVGVSPDGSSEATQKAFIQFLTWFTKRFKPVFLKAMGAHNALGASAKFHEMDEKLTSGQALEYLHNTHMPDMTDVYNVTDDPCDSISLSEDADDVENAYRSAIEFYTARKEAEPKKAGGSNTPQGAGNAASAAGTAAAGVSTESTAAAVEKGNSLVNRLKDAIASTGPGAMFTGVTESWKAVSNWFNSPEEKEEKEKETRYRYNADSRWNDPAQLVRFYAYGMPDKVVYLRDSLIKLESIVAPHVTYRGESAMLDLNARTLRDEVSYAFAPNGMSDGDRAAWMYWYEKRFVPLLLLYASEVRRRKAMDFMEAGSRMPPDELEGVLEAMLRAKDDTGSSLWKINVSPWPNVEVGVDPAIANEAMAMLRSSVTRYEAIKDSPVATPMPSRNISPRASGGLNRYAPTVTPRAGESASGGTIIKQPGQGTRGDINAIPMAKGDGWDATKDTIIAAAEMAGVDPQLAATMAGVESTFRPGVTNGIGAAGLYQHTGTTWKHLMEKHGEKYGLAPNTSPLDSRANSLMAMEYIKDNHKELSKAFPGRKLSDVDLYLAHFLGPSGARRFLAADAGDQAAMHVSDAARRNNSDIFRPGMTVGDVYAHFDKKLQGVRQQHTAGAKSSVLGMVGMPTIQAKSPMAGATPPLMMKLPQSGSAAQDIRNEITNESSEGEEGRLDGSGAQAYLATNGVDMSGMNPQLLKQFYGMVEEYGNATGKTVRINDAFRSFEEQKRLRAKYGAGAAAPGRSLHEFGLALDIDRGTLNEMERLGLMKKYGFTRPVGGEPWHLEPAGIQGNLDGFKRDPQAAASAIIAGMGKGGGGYGTVPGAAKYKRNQDVASAGFTTDASAFGPKPAAYQPSTSPGYMGQAPVTPYMPSSSSSDPAGYEQAAHIAEVQSRAAQPVVDLSGTNDVLNRQLGVQSEILSAVQAGGGNIETLLVQLLEKIGLVTPPDSVTTEPSTPQQTASTSGPAPVVAKKAAVVDTKRPVV